MAKRAAGKATKKGTTKKPIESYDRKNKKRANNPPVGLVTPETDPDADSRKTYQYDPHLDPQLVWAGKAEHTSFEVPMVSLHVHNAISEGDEVERPKAQAHKGNPRGVSATSSRFRHSRLGSARPVSQPGEAYDYTLRRTCVEQRGQSPSIDPQILRKSQKGSPRVQQLRRQDRRSPSSAQGLPRRVQVDTLPPVAHVGRAVAAVDVENRPADALGLSEHASGYEPESTKEGSDRDALRNQSGGTNPISGRVAAFLWLPGHVQLRARQE